MIVSNLKNSSRIEVLHPQFKKIFDYVKSNDLLNAPLGRIEIDGDNLFINNVELTGVAKGDQMLEMHQEYIDIHILLQGRETIGWKALEDIDVISTPYAKDGDCAFSTDKPTSYVTMTVGEFTIAYPEDTHAPAIGRGKIRKLIAKIRVNYPL